MPTRHIGWEFVLSAHKLWDSIKGLHLRRIIAYCGSAPVQEGKKVSLLLRLVYYSNATFIYIAAADKSNFWFHLFLKSNLFLFHFFATQWPQPVFSFSINFKFRIFHGNLSIHLRKNNSPIGDCNFYSLFLVLPYGFWGSVYEAIGGHKP